MSQGSLGYRGKRAAGEGAPGAGPEARVRVAGGGALPRGVGEEFGVSCWALGAWLGLRAGFSSCRGPRPRLLPWAVILSLSRRGCSQRLCSDALRHHTHLGTCLGCWSRPGCKGESSLSNLICILPSRTFKPEFWTERFPKRDGELGLKSMYVTINTTDTQ